MEDGPAVLYTDQTGSNVSRAVWLGREKSDRRYSLSVQSIIKGAISARTRPLPINPRGGMYLVLTSDDVTMEDFCVSINMAPRCHGSRGGASETSKSSGKGQGPRPKALKTKPLLLPVGVVRKLSKILRAYYNGVYPNWSNTDASQIEIWWTEFKKIYRWAPEKEHDIRKSFKQVGARCLRNMLCKAKIADAKTGCGGPEWMKNEHWIGLKQFWAEEKNAANAETNRRNRACNAGLHTGGSIPTTAHRKKMKIELGRKPKPQETFFATHVRKDNSFVDEKAKEVWEKFQELMTQYRKRKGEDLSEYESYLLWTRAAGGIKKEGRVYGLGSESATVSRVLAGAPPSLQPPTYAASTRLQNQINA